MRLVFVVEAFFYFVSNFCIVSQLSPNQQLDIAGWETDMANDVLAALFEKMVAGLVHHQIYFLSEAWDFCSHGLVFSGTSAARIYMQIDI